MREGSADGRLLRQRLYVLGADSATNNSSILMTTYDLGHAPELAGAYANSAPLAKLNPPDLKSQPSGCEVVWHRTDSGFEGDIRPGRCSMEQAGGRTAMQAHLTVSKTGMTEGPATTNTGTNTGNSGSSSPETPAITFRRLR